MTRDRYIGEFKARYFLIWTILFFLFGCILYSKFDFRLEPRPLDKLSMQQQELDHLEQLIDQMERNAVEVQSNLRKLEQETEQYRQSRRPQNLQRNLMKP